MTHERSERTADTHEAGDGAAGDGEGAEELGHVVGVLERLAAVGTGWCWGGGAGDDEEGGGEEEWEVHGWRG